MPGGFGFTGNTFKRILKNSIKYNNNAQTDRASGGSSIAINNKYFHSQIDLKTNLQAFAIRLSLHKTITVRSVYIPPNYKLQPREYTELIQQLPTPFMIMGDFHAHNTLCGSDKVTDKGKVVEDVLSNLNLCILNDGSNTYLHPGIGSYFSKD